MASNAVNEVDIIFKAVAKDAINDIDKVNKAIGETSTKSKDAGTSLNSLSSEFSDIAKTAGMAILSFQTLRTAINFAVDSFQLIREENIALKRTEAIIRTTGGVAGKTAESIKEMANSIEDLTGVDDVAVISASNLLLTFKSIRGEIFDRTLKAVVDLSDVFGGLEGSAIQVAKALEDPTIGLTALRRSGITFSESQQELIKSLVESNKLLEAQTLVLNVIEGQVGGTAQATKDSIDVMKNAWDDFRKSIFSGSDEFVDAFANRMTKALKKFTLAWETYKNRVDIFGNANIKFYENLYKDMKPEEAKSMLDDLNKSFKSHALDYSNISKEYQKQLETLKGFPPAYKELYDKYQKFLSSGINGEIEKIRALQNIVNKYEDLQKQQEKISSGFGSISESSNDKLVLPEIEIPEIDVSSNEAFFDYLEKLKEGDDVLPKIDTTETEKIISFFNSIGEEAENLKDIFEGGLQDAVSQTWDSILDGEASIKDFGKIAEQVIKDIIKQLLIMQTLFAIGSVFGLSGGTIARLGGQNILGNLFGKSVGGSSPAGSDFGSLGVSSSSQLSASSGSNNPIIIENVIVAEDLIRAIPDRSFAQKTRTSTRVLSEVSL